MNFLTGRVVGQTETGVTIQPEGAEGQPLDRRGCASGRRTGTRVTLGMRPEHLEIASGDEAACRSRSTWRRTSAASPTCTPAPPPASPIVLERRGGRENYEGRRIAVSIPPERALVFDEAGERLR